MELKFIGDAVEEFLHLPQSVINAKEQYKYEESFAINHVCPLCYASLVDYSSGEDKKGTKNIILSSLGILPEQQILYCQEMRLLIYSKKLLYGHPSVGPSKINHTHFDI